MRRLLFAAVAATVAAGVAFAGGASAAAHPSGQQFTCAVFTNPTVEYVWSHACNRI